jgi:hypothetical protein
VPVPAPTCPAPGNGQSRCGRDEIGHQLLLLEHLRAHWEPELDIGAVRAVLAAPPPRLAASRSEDAFRAEAGQVTEVRVGDERDVAAATAVAAVGTAFGNVTLATEAQAAVAAAACLHMDSRPIVEHARSG